MCCLVTVLILLLLSASLASFALSLPEYEDAFQDLRGSVVRSLTAAGIDVEALLSFESIACQNAPLRPCPAIRYKRHD